MPFISSIRKNYDVSDKTGTLEKFEITGGNSITTAGGYRIHTFSSVGEAEFKIRSLANNSSDTLGLQRIKQLNVEYMVLAGGGCGGARHGSGGGGAGGYLSSNVTLPAAPYPVNVGAGATGAAFPGPGGPPNGGNSNLNDILTYGGGRGAGYYDYNGTEGGAGGGGCGHTGAGGGGIGGEGANARGYLNSLDRQNQGGAIDLRAGFAGGFGTGGYPDGTGGQGGPGIATPIAGGTRGGGGGGAGWNPGTPDKPGAGGVGGGARGGNSPANGEDAPGSNTGSGGGGGNGNPTRGGSGSPGLVVVRYLT
jgi:hypothetical protein